LRSFFNPSYSLGREIVKICGATGKPQNVGHTETTGERSLKHLRFELNIVERREKISVGCGWADDIQSASVSSTQDSTV